MTELEKKASELLFNGSDIVKNFPSNSNLKDDEKEQCEVALNTFETAHRMLSHCVSVAPGYLSFFFFFFFFFFLCCGS